MSNTIFKRLFEVRLLHGYYLDHWYKDTTGKPAIFQEFGENPNLPLRLLERQANQDFLLANKYNILRDLAIEPTAATADLIKGLRMRWRATPQGFMVGIEVSRSGTGAATKFFPKRALPPGSAWSFSLRTRNPYFQNISSHAMRPTLPGRYHFTNLRAVEDGKVFPSLAGVPPTLVAGQRTWEMGALVMISGNLHLAKKTTVSPADFIPVNNYHWANSGDRLAFPKRFNYRFDPSLSVNTAEFTLLSAETNGTVIKTISKDFTLNPPAPLETTLDFQLLPLPANPTDEERLHPKTLPDGWYFLKVKINGSDFESKRVLLRADIPSSDQALWGLVEISTGQTDPLFQLLNTDGSLKLTPIPGSNPIRWAPPTFEIPIMGRQSYWRYEIDQKVNLPTADTPYTDLEFKLPGQHVVSKAPQRLSLAPTFLTIDPMGIGPTILPAPDKPDLKYDQDQYFSELFLSTIKLI